MLDGIILTLHSLGVLSMRSFFKGLPIFLSAFINVSCGSSTSENTPEPINVVETPLVDDTTPVDDATDNTNFVCGYYDMPLDIASDVKTRIEAEDFDTCDTSYSDITPGNDGGQYRDNDIDINEDLIHSNDHYVFDVQENEYMEYTVDVAKSGLYRLYYRVQQNASETSKFSLFINDIEIVGSNVDLATDDDAPWIYTVSKQVYLTDGPQVVKFNITQGQVNLDYFEVEYDEPLIVTPETTVENMQIGLNLGNTFDAPFEGAWAPVAELKTFVDFKEAGFNHVRMPATWHNHTDINFPYDVNLERMDRTEQVVDWALAQGYVVIINMHHEKWLKDNYSDVNNQERFDAIWRQISARYKNKSARLIFEILNEPHGTSRNMTIDDVNDANERILTIIRESNPTRNVVFSGSGWTAVEDLVATEVPDDDYLIGNFHSYDPHNFAGDCKITWGTPADHDALETKYDEAKAWSVEHNIPVMVNEFGVAKFDWQIPENICAQDQRLLYIQAHVTFATERGFAASYWDGPDSFAVYDRKKDAWAEDEKNILVSENN